MMYGQSLFYTFRLNYVGKDERAFFFGGEGVLNAFKVHFEV